MPQQQIKYPIPTSQEVIVCPSNPYATQGFSIAEPPISDFTTEIYRLYKI